MTIDKHRCMISVDPDKILMRYIDLVKFEDMLNTSSLFFCRADKFSDPFEGSIPKKEYEWRSKEGHQGFDTLHIKLKKFTLINCWQINKNESDAMWRLYLKTNEGVAIQTTTKKLCSALDKSEFRFLVSKIRYIDYENDVWYNEMDYPEKSYNLYIPLIHKRIEFFHENEFRILFDIEHKDQSSDYWDREPNQIGKKIPIDFSNIIDKIILPPTADNEVRRKVESIITKYGYNNIKIYNSKLNDKPYY